MARRRYPRKPRQKPWRHRASHCLRPPSYSRCRPHRRTVDSNLHRRYAGSCRCHLTVVIVPTVVQSPSYPPRTTMPFMFLYFVVVPPNALVCRVATICVPKAAHQRVCPCATATAMSSTTLPIWRPPHHSIGRVRDMGSARIKPRGRALQRLLWTVSE